MNKNQLKFLLIRPAQTYHKKCDYFTITFPIGLLSIAAVLDNNGFNVEILDMLISDFEVHEENEYIRYGMSFNNLRIRLKSCQPHIVGITCPFTSQFEEAKKAAEVTRQELPDSIIIIGGPHLSVASKEVLDECKYINIVVIGEGEDTMLELMQSFEIEKNKFIDIKHINGIAYRKDGEIIQNVIRPFRQDLDSLPFPAYELVDMERYLDKSNRYLYRSRSRRETRQISMITSRGCPFNCIFCSIHLHMGRAWRSHSSNYILRHLEFLSKNYSIEHIHFEDDNITLNKERVNLIFDGIIERNLKITWDVPNGVRADDLDDELLKKFRRAGCIGLSIGVESGDQEVLDKIINKKLSLNKVEEIAYLCKRNKIPLRTFFVIGFPGEKIENMKRTLSFGMYLTKKYDVHWEFLIATPLIGTRLYNICKEKNYFVREPTPNNFLIATCEDGEPMIETEDFSVDDIRQIVNLHKRYMLMHELKRYISSPHKTLLKILTKPTRIKNFLKRNF